MILSCLPGGNISGVGTALLRTANLIFVKVDSVTLTVPTRHKHCYIRLDIFPYRESASSMRAVLVAREACEKGARQSVVQEFQRILPAAVLQSRTISGSILTIEIVIAHLRPRDGTLKECETQH